MHVGFYINGQSWRGYIISAFILHVSYKIILIIKKVDCTKNYLLTTPKLTTCLNILTASLPYECPTI